MRIFVTGGTGFIGSHFLEKALQEGHDVLALKRAGSTPRIPLSKEPEWVVGDLEGNYSKQFHECDALVHLAAYGVVDGMNDWEDCFRWNVHASLQLWLQAIEVGIEKFVICGSCFEYGRSGERFEYIPVDAPLEPTGAYHSSKAAATMAAIGLAIEKNLLLSILRPFHVYGEGEHPRRFWPSLKKAALDGDDFSMTPGEQVRDFIHVDSVAQAFINSVESVQSTPGAIEIKNIGTGRASSLRDFANLYWRKWGAQGKLLVGEVSYRENEVMRFVPEIKVQADL